MICYSSHRKVIKLVTHINPRKKKGLIPLSSLENKTVTIKYTVSTAPLYKVTDADKPTTI